MCLKKINLKKSEKGMMNEQIEGFHEGIGNMLSDGMKRKSIFKKE